MAKTTKPGIKSARRHLGEPTHLAAIPAHGTAVDKDGAWDAGENLKRLGDSPSEASLRAMHAWVDPDKDPATKAAYKLPHHNVSDDGKVGAANMRGVEAAMGRLNGGGLDIPEADRAGVHAHLARHYKDAGMEPPELKASADPGASTMSTDPAVKFLTAILGDEQMAIKMKAKAVEAWQACLANPTNQTEILDSLRQQFGAEFFGPAEDPDQDEDECPTCHGTGEVNGEPCPDCDGTGERMQAQFVASTANDKDGTIDAVWYGGSTVPRVDYATGKPYMLNLDMNGCRMGRLNAGAPVFDAHFTGDDFKSILANMVSGKIGTKAQVGVVQKAWAEGPKGMATLQFDMGNPDGAELYRKAKTGIIRNLSFGAWIYNKDQQGDVSAAGKDPSASDEMAMFTATDWEPFEISPVTVPADFTTQFLSAHGGGRAIPPRAEPATQPASVAPATSASSAAMPGDGLQTGASPSKPGNMPTSGATMDPKTQPGSVAGTETLDAVRGEAVALERKRVTEIRSMGVTHKLENLAATLIDSGATVDEARARFVSAGTITARAEKFKVQLGADFIASFIASGRTPAEFSEAALERLATLGQQTASGEPFPIRGEHAQVTRDQRDTHREQMEAAILLRHNPHFFGEWANVHRGTDSARAEELVAAQRELEAKARPYRNWSFKDMGIESLSLRGIQTRGLSQNEIAEKILAGRIERRDFGPFGTAQFFGGSETVSDFPAVLANVANKTARKAYEAWPQTFRPFCNMVTAADFKPLNRVQLSDAPVLQPLNDKGEFNHVSLTDLNSTYKLATFGHIIAITRQAIINDDMQMFTRIPALQGVAAAQLESNTVWALITSNPAMAYDSVALFNAAHGNLNSGGGSALGVPGLGSGRAAMRTQTAPSGTILNLVPKYAAVPAALETALSQLIAPQQMIATSVSGTVPEWVRNLIPVVEPRLDVASTSAWYLIADPAQIDTLEYAYLEGQQGVYLETKQGFEVDGVQLKIRLDFGAGAIDHRGLQKNVGS